MNLIQICDRLRDMVNGSGCESIRNLNIWNDGQDATLEIYTSSNNRMFTVHCHTHDVTKDDAWFVSRVETDVQFIDKILTMCILQS